MSRPQQQLWWLSIYLSLLAFCIHASEVSTESTNATLKPKENNENLDNYEVIDVSQTNQKGNEQLPTGQTTRIFTTGDVDDDFWLKHLGEDFKYAIHLQVGDSDRYDGVYNMTEDGSNYDIQHDYRIKEIPVDAKENKAENQQNQTPNEQQQQHKQQTENTKQNAKYTSKAENKTSEEEHAPVQTEQKLNEDQVLEKKEETNDFDQIFTIDVDDGMSLIKKLQSIQKLTDTQKITPKIQNINIKYTPKSKTDTQKNTNTKEENNKITNTASTSPTLNSPASPIVVTLPHDEKTVHQLADENTPVVVKMPPVIYHHNTNYDQLSTEQLLMNSATQTQQNPNESEQNTQFTISAHTHQHQQQQQLQQPYENTDFRHYNALSSQHIISRLSSIPQEKQQQQQQQPFYQTSLIEDAATSYQRDPVFNTHGGKTVNDIPSQNTKEQLMKTGGGSIRFILRKPSAAYNNAPAINQISLGNSF